MSPGPRGRGPEARRARRLLPLLAAVLALWLGIWVAPVATAETGLQIAVATVTPAVAGPAEAVTLTLSVTNPGAAASPATTLHAVQGTTRFDDDEAVTQWARGTRPATGRLVATAAVPAIAPGASAPVTVVLPRAGDLSRRAYDVVGVSLEIGAAVTHTFVGVQRSKEYEQLALGWLVPVTVGPDPALWGAPSPTRWKAWEATLAEKGRLARILSATAGTDVTLAVDADLLRTDHTETPSVLTPSPSATAAGPSSAGGPPASGTPAPQVTAAPAPEEVTDPVLAEQIVRDRAAGRYRALIGDRRPLVLPAGDPDLSALAALATTPSPATARAVSRAQAVASAVNGRADVAWPADPLSSGTVIAGYAGLLGAAPAATVVDRDQLGWRLDQGSAGRKARDGSPLLARDPALGAAASAAVRPATAGSARQLFLAHTLTLLNESPGLARTALVAPDRGFDPDPAALAQLLAFTRAVPWLSSTNVSTIIDQARGADPVSVAAGTAANAPAPALTAATAARLSQVAADAGAAVEIRANKERSAADLTARLDALESARWRGHPEAFTTVLDALAAGVAADQQAVRVLAQTINFLADSGRVQITVVNGLEVPVSGVRVRLVPGNPILRVDDPTKVVDIGARSRTTVTYDVTALAAGRVPLSAEVTGPSGRPVGPTTTMLLRATPTGSTIYWILGAVIVLFVALGLWRNRQVHRRTVDAGANVVQVDHNGQVIEQAAPALDPSTAEDR